MRQHEYDMAALYPEREREKLEQEARGKEDFIAYFEKITYTHHPNSSDSIIANWERTAELLKLYSEKKPIPFNTISVKWLENIKLFFLQAPQGGFKKGTISQTTASTYFSIVKAGLKQAFVDEYLPSDISEKVKGIPYKGKQRQALTIEEVNRLVETPCKQDVLKRAFLFSVLTGMRHCDIKQLKWGQIINTNDTWQVEFTQQKTSEATYLPISEQAYHLCGERKSYNRIVFEDLQDASWINRPLTEWVEAAGITKHITFHCARHSFATLQLTNGTDIYTVSKMLGHTNVRTTQIYAKVVDEKKEEAANAIQIKGIDGKKA
jgi:integrase